MFRYLLLAVLFAATPALAQEQVTLKPGPGLDAVTTSCSVCHTLNYIKMNSAFLTLTRGQIPAMTGMRQCSMRRKKFSSSRRSKTG